MDVISNTTVISNFAAIERIELLNRRFKKLYISEQVFEEIQAGLLQGYSFYAELDKQIFPFSENGWLHLTSLNEADELLKRMIHKGYYSPVASLSEILLH